MDKINTYRKILKGIELTRLLTSFLGVLSLIGGIILVLLGFASSHYALSIAMVFISIFSVFFVLNLIFFFISNHYSKKVQEIYKTNLIPYDETKFLSEKEEEKLVYLSSGERYDIKDVNKIRLLFFIIIFTLMCVVLFLLCSIFAPVFSYNDTDFSIFNLLFYDNDAQDVVVDQINESTNFGHNLTIIMTTEIIFSFILSIAIFGVIIAIYLLLFMYSNKLFSFMFNIKHEEQSKQRKKLIGICTSLLLVFVIFVLILLVTMRLIVKTNQEGLHFNYWLYVLLTFSVIVIAFIIIGTHLVFRIISNVRKIENENRVI